jgi:hypothetical protein
MGFVSVSGLAPAEKKLLWAPPRSTIRCAGRTRTQNDMRDWRSPQRFIGVAAAHENPIFGGAIRDVAATHYSRMAYDLRILKHFAEFQIFLKR